MDGGRSLSNDDGNERHPSRPGAMERNARTNLDPLGQQALRLQQAEVRSIAEGPRSQPCM